MRSLGKVGALMLVVLSLTSLETISFAVPVHATAAWNTRILYPSGSGGQLVLDSQDNPHLIYYTTTIVNDSAIGSMKYAFWSGTNWSIQTIDGSDGILALDSSDRPHVLYLSPQGGLEYTAWNGANWVNQSIPSLGVGENFVMALDSNGNPHVVYSTYSLSNNTYTTNLRYAVLIGSTWNIQTIVITQSNSSLSSGLTPSSIVLDSNGYPHIIYTENVVYKYYDPNSYSQEASWNNNNVEYAAWTGTSWLTQTLATNSSSVGNLVLNSKGQPSVCYEHDNSTYIPEYGSFILSGWWNYDYWNGNAWISQKIDSTPAPSGQTYLKLDSSGNAQVYFYKDGLICAHLTGSTWTTESLGSFPATDDYYDGTEGIVDVAFDAHGNLGLTYDGEVGTIRGAAIYGDLTYANIENGGIVPATPSILLPIIIVAVAFTAIIVIIVVYSGQRKTKAKEEKT